MQHQLRQNPTSFTGGESKEITVSQNSDNATSTNNTTQTPGTRLTRLDAEMSRILERRTQRKRKCRRQIRSHNYAFGTNLVKYFSFPNYIPLRRTNFKTIEIDIRDHLGKKIPFEFGTLTVTLHFKRKQ
ncbi:hypothetical protein ALC60_10336 [Trachymyrmex zeteki]|uniref:Uncharacterized protein n=1 Tax=Mycetomoellerius zeteki TaxID=64791 RepID=A0A151WRY4_9HYME|nr:hypothetical protein ALC60_10336 [Trachymyrmex zeteki]